MAERSNLRKPGSGRSTNGALRQSGFSTYAVLMFLFASVSLVLWLSMAQIFSTYTGWVYDLLTRHSIAPPAPPARVLLVEIPERRDEATEWLQVLERCRALGAAQIVFGFVPESGSPALAAALAAGDDVVMARLPGHDLRSGVIDRILPWPDWLRGQDLASGVRVYPDDELGMHRRHPMRVDLGGKPARTLMATAAALRGVSLPEGGEVLVNFLGGARHIPIISLRRVLSGDLIRPLVAGRTVILGYAKDVREAGLHTPLTGAVRSISLLRFQGQTLNTLLQGSAIRTLGMPAQVVLFLALILLALYLYQAISVRIATLLTPVLILLYLLAAWLLLSYQAIWIPVTALTMLQLLAYGLVFVRKADQEEQVIRRTLLETSASLRDRVIPVSFYASEEPWKYVANLLNQTLELQRLIFLEKVEGDHRVREVHALNCGLDEISEMRRDYQRTPYSTAIARNAPLRLERAYLRDDGSGEIQYLVPLSFAGEILGFWAFGVLPASITDSANFESLVDDYAGQIAEMLYHRKRWLEAQGRRRNPFGRYLRLEGWDETHRALHESLRLLERRLLGFERVFDGMGTAAILYDLFGRVLNVNQQMAALMKKLHLSFFDMTAIDMICAISGKDQGTVRQYLYYVVMERTVISLPAPALDDELRSHLLVVRPLVQEDRPMGVEETETLATPFHLGGILIEISDITMFKAMSELQGKLVERLNMKLRNDLEALMLAVDLIADPEQEPGWVAEVMEDRIDNAVAAFAEVQKYLHFTLEVESLERYPVDALLPVDKAVAELRPEADKLGVALLTDMPELMSLVLATPDGLQEIFSTILRILIQDASEGSEVDIIISTSTHSVEYLFSNSGFGLPQERLDDYLHGDVEVSVDEFRKLRLAVKQIHSWEGEFEAHSTMGEGMRFRICLRGFI